MVESAQLDPNPVQQLRTKLEDFTQTNRRALQITGLVVVAGAAGAAGGFLLVKGLTVGKGLAVTNMALAAKSGAAAKAGAVAWPFLVAPTTASSVGTAVANPAVLNPTTAAASLQGMTSLLSNSVANGVTMVDKVNTLFSTLSPTILPLAAGLVSGGAASVAVARQQIRKVQEEVSEQIQQVAETLQAETAHLQRILSNTESKLNTVEAMVTKPVQQAVQPATSSPTRQDRLEEINGIGPVFARRLNEAGIYTFEALATQTPEAVEAIIGKTRAGALFNPATWIAEAQGLVSGQTSEVDAPATEVDAADSDQASVPPVV